MIRALLILCAILCVQSFTKLPFSKQKFFSSSKLQVTEGDTAVVPGIGYEGCLLPSPSGVNTLPTPVQSGIFLGIFGGLFISTVASVQLVDIISSTLPEISSILSSGRILLGVIFLAAGISHFTLKEEFCNIMPAKGTWGFWYLPGSPFFHVAWTGVVEILGGLGYTVGEASRIFNFMLPSPFENLSADSALVLLVLTVLVTPANIYMFTHGAKLPREGPEVPVSFHAIRGAMQISLFTSFYIFGRSALEQFM
mmetsp:Transcript_28170/g.28456  ORF Transcript_28170/g.28456 Transcript_28170/m.28456 type:complete len:253 (+) Transcript_28170:34-792(+)